PAVATLLLVAVASGFAALGFLTATWAASFEQVNFLPTFVVTPLTFLGGVFYSASMAPPALRWLTRSNPVYYLVEALRWAVLGRSDVPPGAGLAVAAVLATGALAAAYAVLRSGWRLRG
ncbi:MAG: ABC transporter permease, partial [Deltaproteobacteria bacterium]